MSDPPLLLAVPNVSEGRDARALDAIAAAFADGPATRLLDRHTDPDHHRTVLTVAGAPGSLARALVAGAATVSQLVEVMRDAAAVTQPAQPVPSDRPRGEHPHVGALDVVPIVYLDPALRGAACAEALVVADLIGTQLQIPVFLYGQLAGGRTRAQLRRGGPAGLRARIAAGEQRPDFGPATLHPRAGATLVAAREPLVAFNLELAPPATVADARRIAALIREGGPEGLPGLRAIGVALRSRRAPATPNASSEPPAGSTPKQPSHNPRVESPGLDAQHIAQVSLNVERPLEVPLAAVVEAVRRHAPVAAAELVGLAPAAALQGFPTDVPLPAFDPKRHVIENALGL